MARYDNLGLIASVGQNGEIGKKDELVWRIKADLEFFKETTMNSYIIMGRNTYESMPKNLPGRNYIVLSKNCSFQLEQPKIVHRNITETLEFVSKKEMSKFWVIGGRVIYSAFLPYVSKMHITEIYDKCPDADTYFPKYDKSEWSESATEKFYCQKTDIYYRHVLSLRKKHK